MSGVRKPSEMWVGRVTPTLTIGRVEACVRPFGARWDWAVEVSNGDDWVMLGDHSCGDADTLESAQLAAEDALEHLLTQALSELRAGRDPLDSPPRPARKAPEEGPP
jgi:hypothetical protein